MAEDEHLGTGEYDPEKYWNARAKTSRGECLKAVCVFKATTEENKSVHKVQKSVIRRTLRGIDLKGKDVLEFGCGAGRWISFFQQYGVIWHGVDISNEMLSMAKKTYRDVDLKKIVDNRIPYPDESMDFIYSVTVIHHNPYDIQEKILSEMVRVLRKDGYFLILEDTCEKGQFNMFPRSRAAWIQLIERHGMTLLKEYGVRYWILRDLTYGFVKKLLLTKKRYTSMQKEISDSESDVRMLFRRLIGRLDLIIDPYIYPLVPMRLASAVVMLFKKRIN